ncbi:MAG: late control protein D [Alphaproteobacteria bacterium]|nr:late control protein D [Alphaproteobacteria bacterium]
MKPQARLTIDGLAAGGELMGRVLSINVTDKDGAGADTCKISLNNWPPASVPRKGAKISIWLGYAGQQLAFMGTFVVDTVEVALFPHTMSITGKSADFREKMKENKERHWDNTSVADIVADIAADHGLVAKVADEVGAHVYSWFGQQDESDIHVLRRLEQRLGGLFSVKDGNLVLAKRGAGANAGGEQLTGLLVTKANLIEGTAKVKYGDRAEYGEVAAYHQDKGKAERVEVRMPSSASAAALYRLGEPFADAAEAEVAAKSKAEDLKRQAVSFSCSIIGTPSARAGAPIGFDVGYPDVDQVDFIIETAKHDFSKSGYKTALDGKLKT